MAPEFRCIGFGTMTLKDDLCVELVEAALHLGYRHLDTAQMYGNEREVGEGLRASGVKREDVFVTTKVWFNRLAPGDFERSVDESLERLESAVGRSADDPLAQRANPARRIRSARCARSSATGSPSISASRISPSP